MTHPVADLRPARGLVALRRVPGPHVGRRSDGLLRIEHQLDLDGVPLPHVLEDMVDDEVHVQRNEDAPTQPDVVKQAVDAELGRCKVLLDQSDELEHQVLAFACELSAKLVR